jgi:hypothetical protein
MKICEAHWSTLRTAIEERGLMPFVSRSQEEAQAVLSRMAAGPFEDDVFEPLLGANFAIAAAAIEDGGLIVMAGDGVCPLCEVAKQSTALAMEWITGAADDQLARARELGVVPGVQ